MSDEKTIAGVAGEFWTRERCYIRELINDPSIREFSLAAARVEPGVRTELHALSVAEWYVITAGKGRIEIGGGPPTDVGVGDVIPIPAGVSQRIENNGDTDLCFQCVCLPRFTTDTYRPLETG